MFPSLSYPSINWGILKQVGKDAVATTVKDISEIKVKSPTWIISHFYAISLLANKNTETNEQVETPYPGRSIIVVNLWYLY